MYNSILIFYQSHVTNFLKLCFNETLNKYIEQYCRNILREGNFSLKLFQLTFRKSRFNFLSMAQYFIFLNALTTSNQLIIFFSCLFFLLFPHSIFLPFWKSNLVAKCKMENDKWHLKYTHAHLFVTLPETCD